MFFLGYGTSNVPDPSDGPEAAGPDIIAKNNCDYMSLQNSTYTTIRPAQPNDQKAWDSHVFHPLQSWEWGEFRKKSGIDVVRLIGEKKGHMTDCWQITFHKIPHTLYTVGYFPKGPEPTPHMMNELKRLGRQKHAIFIQLEPNIIANPESQNSKLETRLIPSHHPLFTQYNFVLDLTKSEEELLAAMHPKTRYNIRVAQKHGVVIKEDNSPQAFETYLQLSTETTDRQKFYAHSHTYHRHMWETLSKSGVAKLYTATYKNEVLAAWVLFLFGDTIYYPYGASSRNHREVMAPTLLLWEIARIAKSQGLKKFDLWGALGPSPDPNDPWFGFHRFKEGFHPKFITYVGSYDLVILPLLYKLYSLANTFRWAILRLKKT
jgi:lipid II:glycine glycyltransferase (peptidoglycan interpeptide bridge formation enzyme)